MNRHSPLPWKAKGRQIFEASKHEMSVAQMGVVTGASSHLGKIESFRISDGEAASNALFIVKSVNNHHALVAALKEIEDLGANGATAARLGNIAHAALIALGED